jgi:formyl-CoA transferase
VLLAFVEGDKNWPVFVKAIDRPELATDPRFTDGKSRSANAPALVAELDRIFGTQPLQYWKKRLDGARLPYGVVQIPEEIVRDPQLLANDIIVPIDDGGTTPRFTVSSPVSVAESPKVAPRLAPALGEHSDDVLRDLGLDPAQIESLRATGAIPATKERAHVAAV